MHAILGNQDWWKDWPAQENRCGPVAARRALEACGVPVYENDAVRLRKGEHALWIAGLGDQWTFYYGRDPSLPDDGLGYSGYPVRLGAPPEIVPVDVAA